MTVTGSSRLSLTVMSAPIYRAASSLVSDKSMATIWLGLNSRAPTIADNPTGPAPTTATVSPGRTPPLRTPTS